MRKTKQEELSHRDIIKLLTEILVSNETRVRFRSKEASLTSNILPFTRCAYDVLFVFKRKLQSEAQRATNLNYTN